jgi:Trk K+ transport system NAD-binding subunit
MRAAGTPVLFGDGTESHFLESLPLRHVGWVVSTLPDLNSNRGLITALKAHGYAGKLAVVAREEAEAVLLERMQVDTVLFPLNNATDYAIAKLTGLIQEERKQAESSV